MQLVTDTQQTFKGSHRDLVGCDMTKRCVSKTLDEAKMTIKDIDVIELHDSNTVQELLTYEALELSD